MMPRSITAIVVLAFFVAPSLCRAETSSVYVEKFSCDTGPYGLRLPKRLPDLMRLGSIVKEETGEIEYWDGYFTTRKYIGFVGLTLGFITFSNDPNRYMVSFAEITSSRWSHIAPFRVGASIKSARGKLGSFATSDPELKTEYGSEGGGISLQTANGSITKVTYACYTG